MCVHEAPHPLQTAELQATIEEQSRQLKELRQLEELRQKEATSAAARLLCSDEAAQQPQSAELQPEAPPLLSLGPRLRLPPPSERPLPQGQASRSALSLWPEKPPDIVEIGGYQVGACAGLGYLRNCQ